MPNTMPPAPGHDSRVKQLISRARAVTAAEGYDIEQRFPTVMRSGEGAWCIDEDGRRLLDVTAASGAVLLGHGHPKVAEAVIEEVRRGGVAFPTTITAARVEVAERLCARYPAGEKAVFFRTGSEATTAAIRLARAATGRDLVLSCGYHGWHDWQLGIEGLRLNAAAAVIHFGYRLDALELLLDALAERVAAVVVTPETAWYPVEHWREMARQCARVGVPFVLDEVMTGLRFGPAGVHGTGVPADLVVVSKGLGNGHSLAAVLGRRDLVDAYDAAALGGTFNREVAPFAAARAVLDVVATEPVHERGFAAGEALRDGAAEVLAAAGLPAWVGGPPLIFDIVLPSEQLASELYAAAFAEGVYFEDSGTQLLTAAHTLADVDFALAALDKAARRVAAAHPDDLSAVDTERLHEFAYDAFGGVLAIDTALLREQIDGILRQVEALRP